MIPLLTRETHWACPNCPVESVTHEARPHTQMHICAGLHGLTAPLVPAGTKAKVTAHEREDYIGSEQAGRYMSVITERNDGQDAMVFAPLVRGRER